MAQDGKVQAFGLLGDPKFWDRLGNFIGSNIDRADDTAKEALRDPQVLAENFLPAGATNKVSSLALKRLDNIQGKVLKKGAEETEVLFKRRAFLQNMGFGRDTHRMAGLSKQQQGATRKLLSEKARQNFFREKGKAPSAEEILKEWDTLNDARRRIRMEKAILEEIRDIEVLQMQGTGEIGTFR